MVLLLLRVLVQNQPGSSAGFSLCLIRPVLPAALDLVDLGDLGHRRSSPLRRKGSSKSPGHRTRTEETELVQVKVERLPTSARTSLDSGTALRSRTWTRFRCEFCCAQVTQTSRTGPWFWSWFPEGRPLYPVLFKVKHESVSKISPEPVDVSTWTSLRVFKHLLSSSCSTGLLSLCDEDDSVYFNIFSVFILYFMILCLHESWRLRGSNL